MQETHSPRRSLALPPRRQGVLVAVVALALAAWSGGAHAGPDLVQNGSFSLTSGATRLFGSVRYRYLNGSVPYLTLTDWSTSGYNFLFTPQSGTTSGTSADNAGAIGADGQLRLWGPGTGSSNGLINSPDGGNFIGDDGAYEFAAVTQTIVGLVPGEAATLTFWWAAAQQSGFTGNTTEQWQVSLGTQTLYTPSNPATPYSLASEAFSGWMQATMTFTPSSSTEVLSFLAIGTPISPSEPPFALLDGVSLAQVSEPASWAMMVTGLAGLISFARWRRKSSAAQIPAAA